MDLLTDKFKHKYKAEIRFADIDAMGHVNNAKYLTYLEQGRLHYLADIIEKPVEWQKQGIILARIEHDFVKPALYKDNLYVYTRCKSIGNKSFNLEHLLIAESGTTKNVIGRSSTILVAFDYDKGHSTQVPEHWKASIYKFENAEESV